ncbi:uncharacterized protein [Glycine max]|uniref:uncharacterized protein n=1 Tax=Glycine max TaxID=3847 RepID=UPI0007194537|nr:uncharacterized protein LOC106795195 [Glycine max]XP_014619597.1 uncharacterized protein LOC106795195 [Glycine max]|eukprot:XP_014619596.1 uncharacterized protein LOC106795195 [Glycine max]
MDQCSLTATSEEQYVNIEIPEQLIRGWQQQGYTHLHYGAIRLVLSLHGRRGLPVTARVSLLDSNYIHYENVVIRTVLTTLYAGSVVLTIFLNYNVNLRDPTLPQRMKVQIQNHVVNLSMPTSHDSALFILTNNQEETPSIVQIPRNISRKELQELIPLQWVTGYEKLRENTKHVSTSQATFRRSIDGLVTTTFKKPDEANNNNSSEVFHSLMIKPKVKEDSRMSIFAVKADGSVIYSDKVNRHFIWDVAPEMCDSDCSCDDHDGDTDENTDDDDDDEDKWKPEPRPCKPPPPPQRRSDPKNGPWTGIKKKYPEDPLWKEKRMVEILGWNHPSLKIPEAPIPCMMFASTTSYDQEFPSLDRKADPVTKVSTKPYIIPTEVGPEGKLKSPSQAEEVLN